MFWVKYGVHSAIHSKTSDIWKKIIHDNLMQYQYWLSSKPTNQIFSSVRKDVLVRKH
jgi:hypothetical protein